MNAKTFNKYTHAIVRSIASSLTTNALRGHSSKSNIPVNLARANEEHLNYINALKQCVDNVIIIPAIEAHPDCVFVEDTAVIIDKVALIPKLGAPSRRGETIAIQQALQEHGIKCVEMDPNSSATLDGGDVLFTGRDIFCGVTSRTNHDGVAFLRSVFSDYPVHPIEINKIEGVGVTPFPSPLQTGQLHLKSTMSMLDDNTVILIDTNANQVFAATYLQPRGYDIEWVKEDEGAAANVVLCNNRVLVREEYKHTLSYLQEKYTGRLKLFPISASEVEKCDGLLTCCSILF